MRHLITFTLLFVCYFAQAQTSYSYSYIEPCSGKQNTIIIPYGQNNVTVNYYGNVSSFNANDFNTGVFSSWMNSVSQINSVQPCGEITTVLTNNVNMTVTQNIVSTVMNVTSIAAMTQSLSGMATNMGGNLGNSVSNSESSGLGDNKNNNKTSGNNSQNNSGSSSGNSVGSGSSVTSNQGQGSQVNLSSSNGSQGSSTNTSSNGNSGTANSNGNASGQSSTDGSQTSSGQSTSGSSTAGSGEDGSTGGQVNPETNNAVGDNGNSSQSTVSAEGSSGNTGSASNGNNNTESSGSSTGTTGTGNGTSTPTNNQDNSGTAKSSGSGNTANSVANAEEGGGSGGSSGSGKGGAKSAAKTGQMIAAGDIVALRSAEDPAAKNQYRFTTSLTRANTNNTRVFGLLGNYTTGSNNTNVTAYMALMVPKSQLTIITANSSMMNFEKDFFNTTTTMVSKKFKGNWKKLTVMGGLNYTAGNFGEARFTNLSAIGGGFYSFNASKKISGSILCLAVYSPFTQFYDGRWWNSSTLIVPFSSWDYAITKTFKFNVSFSGVYELNASVLNYQILTGGKILF